MPLVVFRHTSRLLWARTAALLCTCVAFSVASHGGRLGEGGAIYIFCWSFSFAGTLLVLLVEMFGLETRTPVSWTNFPITFAAYASLLCLFASVAFPLSYLSGYDSRDEIRDHRIASAVFSCLATVAYLVEVSLAKARPGEVAGYMATTPGLLKVCETFVACVIFVFLSDSALYEHYPALKWCLAVYCICFVLSAAIVVLCVGECTGLLPFPFSRFLSVYSFLAVAMYLTATIIWPVYQFDSRYRHRPATRPSSCSYTRSGMCDWDKVVGVAVLTALNLLLYLADLSYSARLVFVSG